MKKIILFGLVFWSVASAFGTNWYVRPTSQGSNNGADWNNAWSVATINQAALNPGDTVWMAGGTYIAGTDFRKSGTAGNPITMKRVRSTDGVAVAAAGWNSAFDSQVLFSQCIVTFTANYLVWDGRIDSGIKTTLGTNLAAGTWLNGAHDCVIQYWEIAGPGNQVHMTIYQSVMGGNDFYNCQFNHMFVHSAAQCMNLQRVHDNIFDHCEISDSDVLNSSDLHPNLVEYQGCPRNTFRYCYLHNWLAVGFQFWNIGGSSLTMFGCVVAHGGSTGVYWLSNNVDSPPGAIIFYNNTFVDASPVVLTSPSQTLAPGTGSIARNNIYYTTNSTLPWNGIGQITDRDYEISNNGGTAGTHSINNGINPFVNLGTGDYHIISTISATLPRDKGVTLASTYNTDPDGNLRGGSGDPWDIGAYEVGGLAPPSPTPIPLFFIQYYPGAIL